jgi:hypothetical protein
MILHPDEQNALDDIDRTLGAGEPHLAAMFTIFTRLAAGDGVPPEEDWVTVHRPAVGPPRRRRPVTARTLRFVLIPAALLVVLAVIVYASVTSRARCVAGRPARSAAAAGYIPASRVCPLTGAANLPSTSR